MKHLTIKTVIYLGLAGATALVLGACSDQPEQVDAPAPEPQVVVVTATPTIEYRIETRPATATAPAEPTAPAFAAGTLLKGSGEGVFYLTEAGTRRHVYDWETFEAFGFAETDIIAVEDEVLTEIPLGETLTRLVRTGDSNLAWVSDGQPYLVYQPEKWQSEAAQMRGFGMPASEFDSALAASLPKRAGFGRDVFLRNHDDIYFYDASRYLIIEADATKVEQLVATGVLPQKDLIDVPLGLLAGYKEIEVEWLNGWLNSDTEAANIRSGPGLAYEVVAVVPGRQKFQIVGHSTLGDWLLVNVDENTGWVAADLVDGAAMAQVLLPVVAEGPAIAADLPQAEPAAMSETAAPETALQPVHCNDVPIRGFGQVWGDHPEVQQQLGCPGWPYKEEGTNAAIQPFQHGVMLWLESDSSYASDPVYVFFEDGSYQRFGDLGPADPAKVTAAPAGFHAVGDKFGKVYWEGTGARVKERLGYATGPAEDSAGAFQQFYNGRMFWAEALDQIFIIYDYSVYDAETERSLRVRTWESYEDKF